jgi:hypothetical protein
MTPGVELFLTFTVVDVVLGVLAALVVGRFATGPRGLLASVVPFLAAFGAMGLLGHALGAHIGPTVAMYGFEVALFGDLAIGVTAALLGALAQAAVVRARRRGASAR